MLPSLKCQILHFWSKFVLPNYLDNKYNFTKSGSATFSYIWQNIIMQKIEKIHIVNPDKDVSQMDRETDK